MYRTTIKCAQRPDVGNALLAVPTPWVRSPGKPATFDVPVTAPEAIAVEASLAAQDGLKSQPFCFSLDLNTQEHKGMRDVRVSGAFQEGCPHLTWEARGPRVAVAAPTFHCDFEHANNSRWR